MEDFNSIHPNFVGIYLCGPTVYGYPHLGHARGPVVFDVLRRYLFHLNYRVRFVRNVTDVGHLVGDADEGEDKIGKLAKAQQLQPMEVAQHYTEAYNSMIRDLNVLPPNIEPRATGHIIEQIELIEKIIANNLAYVVNGSVYFNVIEYAKNHPYGELSGRILEDLIAGAGAETRELEGQEEKKNPNDFALWKKAAPEHLMRWNSPWGEGFPGWHIECTAMSEKYLGLPFDIHAGGMDLLFPHHESEIAQSKAGCGAAPANYWLHNNMITVNGQKMAKSLNNGISISELFSGSHPLLLQAYTPMTLRFFILQAHYRSTLDFSNDALQAAEKGLARLFNAKKSLEKLIPAAENNYEVQPIIDAFFNALNEDINTPIAIAQLFEGARVINSAVDGKILLNESNIILIKQLFSYIESILGLLEEKNADDSVLGNVMQILINMRNNAKTEKNYALSDAIRNDLLTAGIQLKDSKEGSEWERI